MNKKLKRVVISIVGGVLLGFIIGFVVVYIWFLNNNLHQMTSAPINFLGLEIMKVKNVNGEIIKEVNSLSMTIIGIICSAIIYIIYTLVDRDDKHE